LPGNDWRAFLTASRNTIREISWSFQSYLLVGGKYHSDGAEADRVLRLGVPRFALEKRSVILRTGPILEEKGEPRILAAGSHRGRIPSGWGPPA
jgi:hypothetical protein